MNSSSYIHRARSFLLQKLFSLLYGPMAILHEPVGRLVHGKAWSARRLHMLSLTPPARWTLDLGCGSGILLCKLPKNHSIAIGVEPSKAMRRLAKKKGSLVLPGTADAIPAPSHQFDRVVITYPGPWIQDAAAWQELERVMRTGATIGILIGGTYIRGSLSFPRRLLAVVAYGNRNLESTFDDRMLGTERIHGRFFRIEDTWGVAWYWIGTRK